DIYEFDSAASWFRMNFNCVTLQGTSGTVNLCASLQNGLKDYYSDGACGSPINLGRSGLGLYFSVQGSNTLPVGIKLADSADTNFPGFKRFYENIDGINLLGLNIYNDYSAVTPDETNPPTIRWEIVRDNTITINPGTGLRKNLNCQDETLNGRYWGWNVAVIIKGTRYPIGTYYVPEAYGNHLYKIRPMFLHQEYFYDCDSEPRLETNKVHVEYYDFLLKTNLNGNWNTRITNWKTVSVTQNYCTYKDWKWGVGGTQGITNGVTANRIVVKAGHPEDTSLYHTVGNNYINTAAVTGQSIVPDGSPIMNCAVNAHCTGVCGEVEGTGVCNTATRECYCYEGCVSHAQCSQACNYLGGNDCALGVNNCYINDCARGQCSGTSGECYCQFLDSRCSPETCLDTGFCTTPAPQPSTSKCGDGICDAKEKADKKLCPKDCKA
ncbi:MAG: hypothetical protein ABIJ08_06325, partial [Nanoarchaeota archaeon]